MKVNGCADHVAIELPPRKKSTETPSQSTTLNSSNSSHTGDTNLLDAVPPEEQTQVSFININAWVPMTFAAPSVASKLKDKVLKPSEEQKQAASKQILHKISASCSPGELLALMGPSGSGKTSLLTVLGDRQPKQMIRSGDVLFNGEPMSRQVKRRLGFVLQDDLLHETLTVGETLRYIALLRLPQSMPSSEKEARSIHVMGVLGIDKQRDTLVGGRMYKGVSGGERKRVSVGAELLINPSVLFLDEPTSGLDASTALNLVDTLRQLASGGRTIITTIHQPSSRLYASMDTLLLLSQGHIMYFGKANLTDQWFAHLGYPNPGTFNIADYVLDLASNNEPLPASARTHPSQVGKEDAEWDTIQYLTTTAESFLSTHQQKGFTDKRQLRELSFTGRPPSELDGSMSMGSMPDLPPPDQDGRREPSHQSTYGATWISQFFVLLERSVKSRRMDSLNIERFLQVALVGLLAGMFWWQSGQGSTLEDMRDFQGVLFFIMVFPTFGAVFAAIFTFPAEYAMLRKERSSSMYQLSSYYLARTVADLPLVIIMPSIFFNLVYWMTGFAYTASAYFFTFFTVFLMIITGDSAGLWIGAMAMDARRAQTFVTVFVLSQFLVAGFFVRNIPDWIAWARYLSFMYWGYSLVTKIQFGAADVDGCFEEDPSRRCTDEALREELQLPRALDESKGQDVVIIIAFLLFFRLVTYIVLTRRTAK